MVLRSNTFMLLSVVLLLSGCGSDVDLTQDALDKMAGGKRQETVAVSGKVSIGGTPTGGVSIYVHPKQGGAKPIETRTKEDGTYCWTMYVGCDGLPPGEYRLAFTHVPKEGKGKKQGEDLLEGRYKDPLKNEISLNVVAGTPQIDVNYDLK